MDTTQRVSDLIKAETCLASGSGVHVMCEGIELPSWAFLQERSYQLIMDSQPALDLTVCLCQLSLSILELDLSILRHLAPAFWTYSIFLRWIGIHEFQCLVDETGKEIVPEHSLKSWRTITVQLSAEDLDFELSLRLSGLGLDQSAGNESGLRLSKSMACTGLWHLDQLVWNDLLPSWAGLSFPSSMVWLPSFAAAVVEKWPCVMDDHLHTWLTQDQVTVYAIAWESWGWNLVKFTLDGRGLYVSFF